jgi:hypothetical protein
LSGESTDKVVKISSPFNDDGSIEIIAEPDGIHCAPLGVVAVALGVVAVAAAWGLLWFSASLLGRCLLFRLS